LNSNPQLRSKRELIEKFIDENLASVDSDNIEEVFEKFWDEEKIKEFDKICQEENLIIGEVKNVVDTYLYDERKPLNDDIFKTLQTKPKLLERKPIVQRVLGKIMNFVEKFYDGYGGSSEVIVAPTNSLEYKPQLESMMVAETKQSYGENKI
jgi:type I restriction enzyme R subunit